VPERNLHKYSRNSNVSETALSVGHVLLTDYMDIENSYW
jgi:hypothetical protein